MTPISHLFVDLQDPESKFFLLHKPQSSSIWHDVIDIQNHTLYKNYKQLFLRIHIVRDFVRPRVKTISAQF